MNKPWIQVFAAALFEVVWVIGLKHADQLWSWALTAAAIAVSFTFMIRAGRTLPVGTVYAVFVGLGTAGTVLAETIFFSVPLHLSKLLLIITLLIGVIGLKMGTSMKSDEPTKPEQQPKGA
jgi:paired small multidrug resistance pump